MVPMQGFLSVVSPDSFLLFVPVSLFSVSEPYLYPSYLCLPSRTSFFHCPAARLHDHNPQRADGSSHLCLRRWVTCADPARFLCRCLFRTPGFDQKKTLVVPDAVVLLSHSSDHSVSDINRIKRHILTLFLQASPAPLLTTFS